MIEVRELSKRYGPTTVLDGLSFVVPPGRVTGLVGPNGAGKSTTIRLLLDLDRPRTGLVLVRGQRYRDLRDPLRHVGCSFETTALHPTRTVERHLDWLARSNRLPLARVDEVVEAVGLAAVAGRKGRSLSLGMRQRLGLAVALLGDPPILILDEPFNGLDPAGVRWLRRLLRTLAEEGRTVLVSSHLMAEMELVADRVVVIAGGRMLADGPLEDLVQQHGASLEDAFFHLVEHAG